MVVLSGYKSALYETLYSGWGTVTKRTTTQGNGKSVECLWLSPSVVKAREKIETFGPLFAAIVTS